MTRVSFDIDPRVLAKLRALANRRGETVDVVVGEFLGAAIRSPSTGRTQQLRTSHPGEGLVLEPLARPAFGPIEVEYPDTPLDSDSE